MMVIVIWSGNEKVRNEMKTSHEKESQYIESCVDVVPDL
jgi:hypothetical protein